MKIMNLFLVHIKVYLMQSCKVKKNNNKKKKNNNFLMDFQKLQYNILKKFKIVQMMKNKNNTRKVA